ncbi:MAG TPA: ChaN family lipoprotein [Methylomirabilota bacterium]|jgi:uncharacterized iron-regulated protein
MLGRRRLLVLTAGALVAGACASRSGPPWETTRGESHRLTGRIWDVGAERFVGERALVERLVAADFVLLGEKHDNPDHHRLQARLVNALIDAGRRPAVAFEMLRADDEPAITRYLASAPADAAGLGAAVHWDRSGWPAFELYQPIADAAVRAHVPVVAADLSGAMLAGLRRQGASTLDRAFAVRHALDRPAPPDVQAAMAAELDAAHCGQTSKAVLDRMILIQRARDAWMADRLADQGQAVLIAGSGHVRQDRGVPTYLARRAPAARVASVAFVEVVEGVTTPAPYGERFGAARPPFDYVWFTPRVDDEDACARARTR